MKNIQKPIYLYDSKKEIRGSSELSIWQVMGLGCILVYEEIEF